MQASDAACPVRGRCCNTEPSTRCVHRGHYENLRNRRGNCILHRWGVLEPGPGPRRSLVDIPDSSFISDSVSNQHSIADANAAPAELTVQHAAKAYLAAVTPRNKAADRWTADLDNGASVKTLRADAVKARQAERHFLDVLDKTRWPSIVAPNASALVKCTAELASWFDAMSRTTPRRRTVVLLTLS